MTKVLTKQISLEEWKQKQCKARKEFRETALEHGMLYVNSGLRRPKGWALAHNDILHGKSTLNGINGFRYFWIAECAKPHWVVCKCGWRPDWGVLLF